MRVLSAVRAAGVLGAVLLAGALLAAPGALAAADASKPIVQGEPPPDFLLPDTAGRPVRLGDFKGRVILLSFVSCYTDTCFASVNAFESLLTKFGAGRFAAPTICAEVPEALKIDGYAGLLKRCSAGQTLLIDERQEVSTRYFVTSFPTSILIGPDFTVREILQGVAALRDPGLPGRIEALARSVEPLAPPR
jgi:peroxiredoxin